MEALWFEGEKKKRGRLTVLEFNGAERRGGGGDLDVVEILFGAGTAAVTKQAGEELDIDASCQLVGDKSVAEIVDFGIFDAGFGEVAIDGGTDIANQ